MASGQNRRTYGSSARYRIHSSAASNRNSENCFVKAESSVETSVKWCAASTQVTVKPTMTAAASRAAPRMSARFDRTLWRASSSAAATNAAVISSTSVLRTVCDSGVGVVCIRVARVHGPTIANETGRP